MFASETAQTVRDLILAQAGLATKQNHLRGARPSSARMEEIAARLGRYPRELVDAIRQIEELEAVRQDCASGDGIWTKELAALLAELLQAVAAMTEEVHC